MTTYNGYLAEDFIFKADLAFTNLLADSLCTFEGIHPLTQVLETTVALSCGPFGEVFIYILKVILDSWSLRIF